MAFRIPIHRRTEEELDKAISELERRGFKLESKKPIQYHNKNYTYERHGKRKFSHTSEGLSWQAILVREGKGCSAVDAAGN